MGGINVFDILVLLAIAAVVVTFSACNGRAC